MSNIFQNISKKSPLQKWWSKIRLHKIIKQHQHVANFWAPIIEDYFAGKIEKYQLKPKKEFENQKIIWQYWGQGVKADNLPEIIKICFNSVDKHKGDYTVIRLSDETISEYIDLPDFVWKKRENQAFNRTFLSDLLRVALLSTYGGVWLDATILLTDKLPKQYADMDFFMFQRSDEEQHKTYWENVYAYYFGWNPRFKVRVLNSIIFAKQDSIVIDTIKNLLLHFWKTQNSIPDYFFFQVLFNELVNGKLANHNCPIVNDCIPHIIQTKINGKFDHISFDEAEQLTPIHKMAYFDDKALGRLKTNLKI